MLISCSSLVYASRARVALPRQTLTGEDATLNRIDRQRQRKPRKKCLSRAWDLNIGLWQRWIY